MRGTAARAPALPPPKELGVCAVARARGCHRNTARAWLRELEERWGARYVYRRRGRLYTTDVALEHLATLGSERRLDARVRDHEERLRELEKARAADAEQLLVLLRIVRLPKGTLAALHKA